MRLDEAERLVCSLLFSKNLRCGRHVLTLVSIISLGSVETHTNLVKLA